MRLMILPLLLVACAPSTTATLGGEASSDDLDEAGDGTDGTDTDTDDTDDTDDTEEDVYVFPYTGDYYGDMGILAVSDWGDWEIGGCDVAASVDADGGLLGGTECVLEWGGDDAYEFEMAGSVDEDGVVSGEMPLDLGEGDEYIMTVEGLADEDGTMALTFTVGGDFQLLGEAELVREN